MTVHDIATPGMVSDRASTTHNLASHGMLEKGSWYMRFGICEWQHSTRIYKIVEKCEFHIKALLVRACKLKKAVAARGAQTVKGVRYKRSTRYQENSVKPRTGAGGRLIWGNMRKRPH